DPLPRRPCRLRDPDRPGLLRPVGAPRRRRGVRLLFFQVAELPRFARERLSAPARIRDCSPVTKVSALWPHSARSRETGSMQIERKRRVLLVDDSPAFRGLMQWYL